MPLLTTDRPFFFPHRFVVCGFCTGCRLLDIKGDKKSILFLSKNNKNIDLFLTSKMDGVPLFDHRFFCGKLIPLQVDNRTLTSPNKIESSFI
jgi:hypothetical protein